MDPRADEVGRPGQADWEREESPEQIEREIESTRADISETINAIEAKLTPDRIKEQALESAKDAAEQLKDTVLESARQATQEVVDTAQAVTQQRTEAVVHGVTDTVGGVLDLVRQHPVPAALAAVGIGWLLLEERGSSVSSSAGYASRQSYPSDRGMRYERGGYSTYAGGTGRSQDYTGRSGTARTPVLYDGDEEGMLDDVQRQARYLASDAQDKVDDFTDSARQTVGQATDTVGGVLDSLRRNPVPAALAAVGIGWLIMEERGSSAPARTTYPTRRSYSSDRDYRYGTGRRPASYGSSEEGVLDDVQRQAQNLAADAQSAVQDAKDTVTDVAADARQTVDQALSRADEARQDLSWEMRYQAQRLPSRFEQMVHDNPLAVGLVALGIGAAIGAALPETETENRLMGEARDDLARRTGRVVQQAQSALEETVQEAKTAAESVKQTAQQEIEEKGLVDRVKSAAEETVQSAKQAVETTKESAKSEAKNLADDASSAARSVKATAQDASDDDNDRGSSGTSGSSGSTGGRSTTGSSGSSGTSGSTGSMGGRSTTGSTGTSTSGSTGSTGPTGSSGSSGSTGGRSSTGGRGNT